MKYSTKELQLGSQEDDYEEADIKWEENRDKYWEQFGKLKGRMKKKEFVFFKEKSLHDSSIIDIKVKDIGSENYLKKTKIRYKIPISVIIRVMDPSEEIVHILEYQEVRQFTFDYPTSNPTFFNENDGINTRGYDEITERNKKTLKHEILFCFRN